MKAIAHARCIWGEYEAAMVKVRAEKDAAAQKRMATDQALPIRKRLITAVVEVYQHLLAHIGNPGELGTLANWDQHIQPMLLDKPGAELAKFLAESLPPDAQLPKAYAGHPRLIVPTHRTTLTAGEPLTLEVILLDAKPARAAAIYWRPIGEGDFRSQPLTHIARGVYNVTLPPEATETDLEYHLEAVADNGQVLHFPPHPEVNRTVVVVPPN